MKKQSNVSSSVSQDGPLSWGVDVSSQKLDLAGHGVPQVCTFKNDPDGIQKLLEHVRSQPLARILVEATGGYEMPLVVALHEAGLPVIIINPRQVRAFATAVGELAKTDPLDARIIARFGHDLRPEWRPIPSEKQRLFTVQADWRRQLLQMRAAELCRQQQVAFAEIRAAHQQLIEKFNELLAVVEEQLRQAILEDADWNALDQLLQSVKGVGPATSHALIADLPELGRLDEKQIAKLTGVAPRNRDSGKSHLPRTIGGGRSSVRATLYMATFNAYRCNPQIREFYQRLRAAGKPFKVAITACMRKLLIILNAIVRTKTPWKNPMKNINNT